MDSLLSGTISLLCIAVVVAILARRLQLPYTVGLVVTGIGLAFARLQTGAMLTHDFIFDVILPPLIFEAALSMQWHKLRQDMLLSLTLSTVGVLISAVVVAVCMIFCLDWPWLPAAAFGILIAATDPIAVIAMFKDTQIKGRLRLLVESESLFNDGVAAVLFALCFAWIKGYGAISATGAGTLLAAMVGGGILCGVLVGVAAVLLAGRTNDYLVETTVTAVAAYGSFMLAEHWHFSGVLATVCTGLVMGNLGVFREHNRSFYGHVFILAFWNFAAFIANSLVFLLIGLAVSRIAFDALNWRALLGTIAFVLLGRALTVYPLCLLFANTRWAVPVREQHILWWGGLRGALALALALALPPDFVYRNEILVAAFVVVVFSVIFQGLTMRWLLRKLGFIPAVAQSETPHEVAKSR